MRGAKCTGHTKSQTACSTSNSLCFSAFLAKSLQLKCCCKSEAQKWLSFVYNYNKAFRTKNKKWQTVDAWMKCATPETEAGAEKTTFCEKHKRHSKALRNERMLKQDENALKIYLEGQNICVAM